MSFSNINYNKFSSTSETNLQNKRNLRNLHINFKLLSIAMKDSVYRNKTFIQLQVKNKELRKCTPVKLKCKHLKFLKSRRFTVLEFKDRYKSNLITIYFRALTISYLNNNSLINRLTKQLIIRPSRMIK